MSEANSNEYARKSPFERSSAADFPEPANRQRNDGASPVSQGGKAVNDDAAFDELSDTEWLNITLENILKMNSLQDNGNQPEDDVNSLVLSSLESMQGAASVPSEPMVPTEAVEDIPTQEPPPEEPFVISEPVSRDNAYHALDDEPPQMTEIDSPDSWRPDELPETDNADLTEPTEISETDIMDFAEPDEPPETDDDAFPEPSELTEADELPPFALDSPDPVDIAGLPPMDSPELWEPDTPQDYDHSFTSEDTAVETEITEEDEADELPPFAWDSPDPVDIAGLPPIDSPELWEPDTPQDYDHSFTSEDTAVETESTEPVESYELPPMDSPELWEPDTPQDYDHSFTSEDTAVETESTEPAESYGLPPMDSPELWEPDTQQDYDHPITSEGTAVETESTANSQTDIQNDISGTFDSTHVSISDGFSLPYEEATDNVKGFSKTSEVDKMENINILTKSNKKAVKSKKNETDYYTHGFTKTHAGISEDNPATLVVSLRSVLEFIMKNVVIVLLAALMCSMAGYIYTQKFVKPKYLSNTKIIIFTSEPNNQNPPSWDDLQLSFTLLTDCSQIVKSRDVLEDVIKELELSTSYNELLENIDVSFMSNSRIIEISVTDEDPLEAMIIVKKLREVSMRYINDNLEVYGSKIIQKENIPHQPLSTYTKFYVMVGAVIGILLSAGVLAVIYIVQLEKEFVKKQQKAAAKKK